MATTTTITKTVSISPGEQFTLPNGATIISISDILDNSCDFTLPDPEPFVEYKYSFALNEDDNDNHPMGHLVNISEISVDNVTISLDFSAQDTDNTNNGTKVGVWNSEVAANNLLMTSVPLRFISVVFDPRGSNVKADSAIVTIKMPESYLNKVLLKITNDKFDNGLYLKGYL